MIDLCPFDDFAARLTGMIRSGGVAEPDFAPLARELHCLQCESIGLLGSLTNSRGIDSESVSDWRLLPALPAAMFKESELTSLPADRRERFFLSSGTSEPVRSRHFHHRESLQLYELSLLDWFSRNVATHERTRFVSLTPPEAGVPNSSLVHMFERVGRTSGGTDFFGLVDATGAWEVKFEEFVESLTEANVVVRPVLLMGTAFSFVQVLDRMKAERIKIPLPPGSKVMETGGYKGRSRVVPKFELYRKLRIRFGVPEDDIVCEYGMSELSSQAYDTGRESDIDGEELRVFHFPSWARAVVVSPETGAEVADGEIGLLRVFDLANVYSVMAIQTEDLALRRGSGFNLIGRVPRSEPRGCSLMPAAG